MREPLVQNGADKAQVEKARKKELTGRDQELDDLRAVLRSIAGRRFIWRLMGKCKVFGSCDDPSGSRVYYKVGQQDLGHFILAEVVAADENKLLEMMKEAKDEDYV